MTEERYYKQSIEILIDREREVFQRIEALSKKTGKPVEELVDWAIGIGIEKHLSETVRVLERLHDGQE